MQTTTASVRRPRDNCLQHANFSSSREESTWDPGTLLLDPCSVDESLVEHCDKRFTPNNQQVQDASAERLEQYHVVTQQFA